MNPSGLNPAAVVIATIAGGFMDGVGGEGELAFVAVSFLSGRWSKSPWRVTKLAFGLYARVYSSVALSG